MSASLPRLLLIAATAQPSLTNSSSPTASQMTADERAEAEIVAGRDELERTREGLERYRGKVADHFVGTSERLRELTLQYRAIYNHLAEGAGELCPQGFEKLEGGLGLDARLLCLPMSRSQRAVL